MHDIWNPWHGCVKCSEGCCHCYMYFLDLDRVRDRDGADILMQLYEKGRQGIRGAKNKIKNISSDLLKNFGILLTGEDISFISAYGYVKAA